MGLILDTNFIICAERAARRGTSASTESFLADHPEETFFITFTVAGELACGRSAALRPAWDRLCSPFQILPWTMEISWRYGEIYRVLESKGLLIGANDLWIAATALTYRMGVVTNNREEFRRVPGLTVYPY